MYSGESPTSLPRSITCASVRLSAGSASSPDAPCSSAARASTRSNVPRETKAFGVSISLDTTKHNVQLSLDRLTDRVRERERGGESRVDVTRRRLARL